MKTLKIIIISSSLVLNHIGYAQLYDNSFNGNGVWNRKVYNYANSLNSISLQSDGKILYAGGGAPSSSQPKFVVGRINADGTNDNTFDSDGVVDYNFGTVYDEAYAVKEINSKIYAIGNKETSTTVDNLLVRLTNNGSLDLTFNSVGYISPVIEAQYNYSTALFGSSDNNVIVLGSSSPASTNYDLTAFKVDANAAYINGFGTSGKSIFGSDNDFTVQSQATITSNNVIYIFESNALIKIKANGHLDSTFGVNGRFALSLAALNLTGIAVQKDGKILVSGTGNNSDFVVFRLNTNGSNDISFGINGKVIVPFSGQFNSAKTITVDTSYINGKIFVAGYTAFNGGNISYFALTRLSPTDGTIEAQAEFQPNNLNGTAQEILFQTDGKILVAGNSIGYSVADNIVARINPNFTNVVATGVQESVSLSSGINLFPNPASQNINVHSVYNIEQIKIIDVLGNEVMNLTSSGNTQVDISSLPKGLYNFVITTDRGTGNKKVSVQ